MDLILGGITNRLCEGRSLIQNGGRLETRGPWREGERAHEGNRVGNWIHDLITWSKVGGQFENDW